MKNEGNNDRLARATIGLSALFLALNSNLWWLVLAIPALVTAYTGYCHLYKILGMSTLPKKSSKKK